MRSSLRLRGAGLDILVAAGVADSLGARLVGQARFEAIYVAGAGVSYARLGAFSLSDGCGLWDSYPTPPRGCDSHSMGRVGPLNWANDRSSSSPRIACV
jgi:hypothetical protein